MQIEEGPFFVVKDYRKIVNKAKKEKQKLQLAKSQQFTTHESIPEDIKEQINQILFQLTQPEKYQGSNKGKMCQNDWDMDDQHLIYYGHMLESRTSEEPQEITDIEEFLSLEAKKKL